MWLTAIADCATWLTQPPYVAAQHSSPQTLNGNYFVPRDDERQLQRSCLDVSIASLLLLLLTSMLRSSSESEL
jgi:hypothetical protein